MRDRLFLRLPEDELHGPEAGPLAGATLRAFAPEAALEPYIGTLMLYRETLASEVVEHVVPDGGLRLVVNLGEAPRTGDGPGLVAGVLGASAAPARVTLRGRIHAFSVTLKPGAATALLGVPAGEFSEAHASLDALWGHHDAAELQERMAEARSDAARAGVLQSALRQRLGDAHPAPAQQAQLALQLIATRRGPLRDIAVQLGCSERRLQQLFHAQVGLPPRTWRRLLRLQDCLRRLRANGTSTPAWAELAIDCGFYDQPHLVNEFQALCGMSPTDYWHSVVSHSSKTPA